MISLGCVDAGVTEAQCSDYLKEVEGLTRKPLAQVQEGSDRVKTERTTRSGSAASATVASR